MHIEENKSLKKLNTFNIECNARRFAEISNVQDLKEILRAHSNEPLFILGGGSNLLLTKDIDALVLHVNLKGISIISETNDYVTLEVMAGENWHELVLFCIANNFGGIENLSLIPGNVGTAPIQNIGAYGAELSDVFVSCKTIEIATLNEERFLKEDCEFSYRNSIFKNKAKGHYIITSISVKLTKVNHKLNISYGAIKDILAFRNITNPSIKDISDAVIEIRKTKLPDPSVLGNSGSFFKNPIVDQKSFTALRSNHPDIPFYEISPEEIKLPAAWLIERAGFKGKRFGDAGVHENQALVLVNHGDATGNEIWDLAMKIQKTVVELFGVHLDPEVNIV